MSNLVTYLIDKELYSNPATQHNIVLKITKYRHGEETLIHVEHGCKLKSKKFGSEQFIYKNENGRAKLLARGTFESKLKRFDISQTDKAMKILEEHSYVGKNGKPDMVHILVMIGEGYAIGTIDFLNEERRGNFVVTVWVVNK